MSEDHTDGAFEENPYICTPDENWRPPEPEMTYQEQQEFLDDLFRPYDGPVDEIF